MNDLKKALKNLSQPTIEMEKFKRNLRADLLGRQRPAGSFSKGSFAILLGLTSTFATLVVLFIAKPSYPSQVNAWITGKTSLSQPAFPVGTDLINPSSARNLFEPNKVNSGTWPYPSEEADRYAAEQLFTQNYPGGSNPFQSLAPAALYAIREFTSPDGKRVLVYTKIDPDSNQDTVPVSY